MAKKKSNAADEQPKTGGHDFKDPDVVLAESDLRDTLRKLDDAGVVMSEEQFRTLTDFERGVAKEWAGLRKDGAKIGCPPSLHPFATTAVIAECTDRAEEQAKARRLHVRCTFNKPASVLATGDKEGDSIKMSMVIPSDDIIRASVAEDFFCGKRVAVEFSLRGLDKWADTLPGVEDNLPEIIECETDIRGYSRLMKGWKVSFLVSFDLIDDNEANRVYANHQGSARFTVIGDIPKKERVKKLTATKSFGESHKPLDGQKSLWNPTNDTSKIVREGQFESPDEYLVPLTEDGATATVYVGIGDNGMFYHSSDLYFVDEDGVEFANDLGHPLYDKDSGRPSAIEAMKAEVGSMVDVASGNGASSLVVNELKDALQKIESGVLLHPMPE